MAYTTTSHAAHAGLAERFSAAVKSVREAFHRRQVYKQTVSELGGLSDRDLKDLGITRSMISRVAIEAAYGK